jgi:hypothetical protein
VERHESRLTGARSGAYCHTPPAGHGLRCAGQWGMARGAPSGGADARRDGPRRRPDAGDGPGPGPSDPGNARAGGRRGNRVRGSGGGLRVAGKTGTAQRAVVGGFGRRTPRGLVRRFVADARPALGGGGRGGRIQPRISGPRRWRRPSSAAWRRRSRHWPGWNVRRRCGGRREVVRAFRRLGGGATRIGDADVRTITHDSREVAAGAVFAALPGAHHHGLDFLDEAEVRGAAAVLTDREPPAGNPLPWIVTDRPRSSWPARRDPAGDPAASLEVVAVTGTNGKSTVVDLVRTILDAARRPCAALGDAGRRPARRAPSCRTAHHTRGHGSGGVRPHGGGGGSLGPRPGGGRPTPWFSSG